MRQAGRNIILILASGGGVGYVPYCPGTVGTLIAVPLSLAVNHLAMTDPLLAAISLASLTAIAIGLADAASRALSIKDPPVIVVDEIAGFVLANFLNTSGPGLLIAFVAFRFFDITKIFPAKSLEALPGGAGIVLDDIVAGLYAFLILRLISASGWL